MWLSLDGCLLSICLYCLCHGPALNLLSLQNLLSVHVVTKVFAFTLSVLTTHKQLSQSGSTSFGNAIQTLMTIYASKCDFMLFQTTLSQYTVMVLCAESQEQLQFPAEDRRIHMLSH